MLTNFDPGVNIKKGGLVLGGLGLGLWGLVCRNDIKRVRLVLVVT